MIPPASIGWEVFLYAAFIRLLNGHTPSYYTGCSLLNAKRDYMYRTVSIPEDKDG
jgi:hypothetical protein